jgi:Zn-dependent M16 (insulinase) family peptidase
MNKGMNMATRLDYLRDCVASLQEELAYYMENGGSPEAIEAVTYDLNWHLDAFEVEYANDCQ